MDPDRIRRSSTPVTGRRVGPCVAVGRLHGRRAVKHYIPLIQMARIRHLSHAPIVEALVDIGASTPEGFDAARLKSAHGIIGDAYPIVDEQSLMQGAIAFKATPAGTTTSSTSTAPVVRGYVFKSADGKSLVQFRRDGFTYNRLAPYTSWDTIRPEVMRLWTIYLAAAGPIGWQRIGLRYINHIPIPQAGVALERILLTPVPVPKDSPDLVAELFSRIVLRDPENDIAGIVVTAVQPTPDPRQANLVIDIDAYREVSSGPANGAGVERTLDALHELKNKLFFGSITEETAERFA
jgi:uncharacterized protein (TIGR04255 family)